MKWSLFNWKKPVVSSGEPEDYQVVKNTVSQNEGNITNINSQITNVNNQLNNTVSTNTTQTITGAKTFTEDVVINKTPVPLTLKATDNNKTYIVYKDSANNSNLSIGANATSASIEVNRGNLEIETQQENKNISINTGRVKLNRSILEFGTEINTGYGGGVVKFIPEDNSTKTLQFFNNNATDQRRFKLAIPEPVDNNNPATKNYVDTKETAINNQITAINNRIVENNTILKRVYTFSPTSSTLSKIGAICRYLLEITDLPNSVVLGISADFKQNINPHQLPSYWEISYAYGSNVAGENRKLYIQLTGDKEIYEIFNDLGIPPNIDFSNFSITVFYMNNSNREIEQTYQGQIVNLEERLGINNEN